MEPNVGQGNEGRGLPMQHWFSFLAVVTDNYEWVPQNMLNDQMLSEQDLLACSVPKSVALIESGMGKCRPGIVIN